MQVRMKIIDVTDIFSAGSKSHGKAGAVYCLWIVDVLDGVLA